MIRVRQIKVNVDEEVSLKKLAAKKLGISVSEIVDLKINKRSLDARKKPILYYIYEVDVTVVNESDILLNNKSVDVLKTPNEKFEINVSSKVSRKKIYIIGSGPAGLLCAYTLAKYGFLPVIIERGNPVEKRVEDVEAFWNSGKLLLNSNVQFGEGGAGTFSDGKLNTLIKDKEHIGKYVFELFVKCGAPKEIMYDAKPHIGTNVLRNVVINLRNEIISLGGEFRYNTILTDLVIENEKLKAIVVNFEEKILCDNVVLAIGHSARDTFKMLLEKDVELESKPFAVGLRVMHPQKMINKSQIGVYEHEKLLNQSYKLTYNTKSNRGVYTFCMCPGGYVVNASSEDKKLAINGMSNYERNSGIANSAVIVTVSNADFGSTPLDGVLFQEKLEAAAYNACLGKVPIQLYKDFKNNKKSNKLGSFNPQIKGEYGFGNLNDFLPEYISKSIIEGMENFGNKIKGFNSDDAVLAGIESRTSSPVKILRDNFFEANVKGVFPCGEGSGYAGGITSAAIDGVNVAKTIIEKK